MIPVDHSHRIQISSFGFLPHFGLYDLYSNGVAAY